MKLFAFFLFYFALATSTFGRSFSRCSLAREMERLGVPRHELARWTCIAERESCYRTHVVGPPNTDGSHDYGIFQINDLYWCQPSNGRFSYNACSVNCDDLLTDNISISVRCARKIQRQQGWNAWTTWKYCNGTLPSIEPCFQGVNDYFVLADK